MKKVNKGGQPKRGKNKSVIVSISLTESELKEIDALANAFSFNRSQILRLAFSRFKKGLSSD